jgi:YVTN family beta-propeller protein
VEAHAIQSTGAPSSNFPIEGQNCPWVSATFRILGPIEACRGGRPLPLGGPRQQALLAILLVCANRAVALDVLLESVWREPDAISGRKRAQMAVARLRRALEPLARDRGGESVLRTVNGGYLLAVAPGELDADVFEARLQAGADALESGDPARAAALLREALALWRGPALAELAHEPLAQPEIQRLEELRLTALETRVDADLQLGRHADLVGELEALAATHLTRERLAGQLMLALYRCERHADALDVYQRTRSHLADELGLEPGPGLRALQAAVLRQSPALAPAHTPAPRPATRRRRPALAAVAAAVAIGALAVLVGSPAGDTGRLPLAANGIGMIDGDDGRLLAQFPAGRGPTTLALGGGSAWVGNALDGTVSRIDRRRGQVATVDIGDAPTALVFGHGGLWVTGGSDGTVRRIDATTNRVVSSVRVGNGPRGLAVGFGALWVSTTVDGRVVRIDPGTGRPSREIAIGGEPTALAAGHDALWVADEAGGAVVRVDPRSGTPLKAINVGNAPAGIAIGHDAVWVANRGDGTVSRIDPATDAVTDTLRVGRAPAAITAEGDRVWVAGDDETVSVLDASARRPVATVRLAASASAVAAADGVLWTAAVPTPGSRRGGVLRVGGPPCRTDDCLDPASYDPAGYGLRSLLYDGLLAYRRTGGAAGAALVGNLATGVPAPGADGRTYVFTLRPGIRYSNGAPVRPEDFRRSIERLLALSGREIPVFRGLAGAAVCAHEPGRCDLSGSIRSDARAGTVTVRLTRPDADFLHELATPLAAIVPAAGPTRGAALPGTGPYALDRFHRAGSIRLVRNPHFREWSRDARPDGLADEIRVRMDEDLDAQIAALRRDELDVVQVTGAAGPDVSPRRLREIARQLPGRLHTQASLNTAYAFLDVGAPPFDDVRARRALGYAVDRARVLELEGGAEYARPTCQVLPPGIPGYRPACPYTVAPNPSGSWTAPDLARARLLVVRSGTRGAHVAVRVHEQRAAVGGYLVHLLRRLGYRSTLRVVRDLDTLWSAASHGRARAQVVVGAWSADFVAASAFVAPLFGCGPAPNVSGYCDAGLEAQLRRARTAGRSERAWRRVDRRLVATAPAIPLVNRRTAVLVSPRVGNVQQHPLLETLLDQLWVE